MVESTKYFKHHYKCLHIPHIHLLTFLLMLSSTLQVEYHNYHHLETEAQRIQSFTLIRERLLSISGEGSGNPLQCSCLETPRGGGAWWAAVYGVAQSRTLLKRQRQQQFWGEPHSDVCLTNLMVSASRPLTPVP